MNEVIRTRREILKHIETLAEENGDVMYHLSLKVIYDYLKGKMDNTPVPSELEQILDDLCKASNAFNKDKIGYYWRELL
jgi:hypothetical protein